MDDPCLRCNNRVANGGICRQDLKDYAIVTTCSHVLCLQCVESTGFANKDVKTRSCPVCQQSLPNVDDAARTNLRPTDEYKTSVLCGLDPTTIMECASSALSFWNYQMLQETAYQQHLLLALSKKYSRLDADANRTVDDANHQIGELHTKLKAASDVNANLQSKSLELAESCRSREKKYADLRKLYEALKKQTQHNNQNLTNEAVAEHTVRSFTANPGPGILGSFSSTKDNINVANVSETHPAHDTWMPSDQRVVDQLHHHQQARSGSQYSGQGHKMPPPQRPARSIDFSSVNIHTLNRTPLGSLRAPADRSHKAVNRFSHQTGMMPSGSARRVSTRSSGNDHTGHSRQSSAASYGGISGGMKVGSAVTDAEIRRQSGYIPLRNLGHHDIGSEPKISRHF